MNNGNSVVPQKSNTDKRQSQEVVTAGIARAEQAVVMVVQIVHNYIKRSVVKEISAFMTFTLLPQ